MSQTLWGVLILAIFGGGLYVWSFTTNKGEVNTIVTEDIAGAVIGGSGTASQVTGLFGAYEAYAPEKILRASADRDVVLFFRADWCPTCRALDVDIRSKLETIPKDVSILYLNYDTETALKQKYGVTYQHTLVQVDAEGGLIAKWSKSLSLEDVLSHIK